MSSIHFLHMIDPQRRQWWRRFLMLNLFPQSGQKGTSWSLTQGTTDFSIALEGKKGKSSSAFWSYSQGESQNGMTVSKGLDLPLIFEVSVFALSNAVSWTGKHKAKQSYCWGTCSTLLPLILSRQCTFALLRLTGQSQPQLSKQFHKVHVSFINSYTCKNFPGLGLSW